MKDAKEKKFEKLYKTYVKLVSFIISKYVDVADDREDLVSDVFVDFYLKMEGVENVKYYLVSSAKNKAITYVKKKKKENIVYEEISLNDKDGHGDGSYWQTIDDMKNVLTDKEIEIIIKRVIFDMTFKELSVEYDKPLKTIYSVYKRAIKKYRKHVRG